MKVSLPGHEANKITTYIGLDPFATDCFIDCKLADQLHAKGEETRLQVITMEAIDSVMSMKLIQNVIVHSLDETVNYTINYLYGKDPWPFDLDDSPKPSDLEDCPHLQGIPIKFARDPRIGILVGMNQPELICPLESIQGPSCKPFATQHMMGWALNGLVASRTKSKGIHIHHIKCRETTKLCHQLDQLYAQDFIDP